MKQISLIFIALSLWILPDSTLHSVWAESKLRDNNAGWNNLSSADVPTIITSKTMNLNSASKNFSYAGGVTLVKGDLTMTAERLNGKYNDGQGIDELTAMERVVITKGSTIKARSNKAVYDKKTETMLLTDNPEVTQEDSILTANLVRIFLKENKSLAEGNVRVKLIPKK